MAFILTLMCECLISTRKTDVVREGLADGAGFLSVLEPRGPLS